MLGCSPPRFAPCPSLRWARHLRVIDVTLASVGERTAAEKYLERRRADPDYADHYGKASRRVAMFDAVIRDLDARRVEMGLTKADLASRADLPAAGVRRLFSQQQKNPTLTTLVAIAEALGLSLQLAAPMVAKSATQVRPEQPALRTSSTRASRIQRRTA
jgi:DNA-binding phage protein